ncbi:MAG: hypothetical protein KDI82_03760 [Gammaproteobacteria bacterium]|nr:hypothetical protein [Gammaproteobacteria bacterium]
MTTATSTPAGERQPGLGEAFDRWSGELRPLFGAMSDLAISEARLAAVSLVSMFAAAIALAILAAVAWASLSVAIGLWMFVGTDVWIKVILWTALISAAGAAAAYLLICRLSGYLDFRETRGLLLGAGSSNAMNADRSSRNVQRHSESGT